MNKEDRKKIQKIKKDIELKYPAFSVDNRDEGLEIRTNIKSIFNDNELTILFRNKNYNGNYRVETCSLEYLKEGTQDMNNSVKKVLYNNSLYANKIYINNVIFEDPEDSYIETQLIMFSSNETFLIENISTLISAIISILSQSNADEPYDNWIW